MPGATWHGLQCSIHWHQQGCSCSKHSRMVHAVGTSKGRCWPDCHHAHPNVPSVCAPPAQQPTTITGSRQRQPQQPTSILCSYRSSCCFMSSLSRAASRLPTATCSRSASASMTAASSCVASAFICKQQAASHHTLSQHQLIRILPNCPTANCQTCQRQGDHQIAARQLQAAFHLVGPSRGLHLPPQSLLPQLRLQLQHLCSLEQQVASALLQCRAYFACCLVAALAGLLGMPVSLMKLRLLGLRTAPGTRRTTQHHRKGLAAWL
jgi:hypothetical protein